MEPGCRFTLLGCSRPFLEEAELLGFAVGSAGYLSPQTHSLCLWWLQKAAKLQANVTASKKKNGQKLETTIHASNRLLNQECNKP